jgi:hypothetical protein
MNSHPVPRFTMCVTPTATFQRDETARACNVSISAYSLNSGGADQIVQSYSQHHQMYLLSIAHLLSFLFKDLA